MASPRSCRILTISSTTTRAGELAERIITTSNSAAPVEEGAEHLLAWTISNKYYTAPVHFSIAQTTDIKGEQDAADIPACIFVFALTEPFKDAFSSLISRLGGSDFEVSLAVSVPSPGSTRESTDDEQDALEAFFGEFGFEYVNGHSTEDNMSKYDHDVDDLQGIPGLGRVVDALSTILWPSMIQQAGSRRAKARSVVSVPGPPGEEDGLRALLKVDRDTSTSREMAALEKWLEEGAEDEKDPWHGPGFGENSSGLHSQPESGFDDNFSDFVSAPAEDPALPSQAEVESMSHEIFGSVPDDADDSDPQTPFDLSRVLGALEAMKEEIAGISDEDEKRRAAAKVALGLVYGLEER